MPRPAQPLLDAATLARLATLQLRVEAVVQGVLAGLHRSPHQGSSVEFAEHKEYSPGDEVRHLDWKALGKFDRYYVKRFEDETDLRALFLLDCSGSMGYGAPLSKLQYGSVLLGAMAYLLVRQGDQPGLLTFDRKVRSFLPPASRNGQLARLVRTLEQLTPGGQTSLDAPVRAASELSPRRGLVVLVSDLFDHRPENLGLLRHLRARGHQVALFHLLHPDELELPFRDVAFFRSMEDERELLVDPAGVRGAYQQELRRFLDGVRDSCRRWEVRHVLCRCDEPVDRLLLRFWAGRTRRAG